MFMHPDQHAVGLCQAQASSCGAEYVEEARGGGGVHEEPCHDAAAAPRFDSIRAQDYARLDKAGCAYLDYTGGGLYAASLVRDHMKLLMASILGNPHSESSASKLATRLADEARGAILAFFRASPDEYTVVFTSNATGALKIVGESYPFEPGGTFMATFDNHNSVNGMREFAKTKGASIVNVPLYSADLSIDRMFLDDALRKPWLECGGQIDNNLFVYPAQSNFSGVQHPLEFIKRAQKRGWDVLLDASAFVATNRLDLGVWHPEFVVFSFYKMFGYPTGVGCLIAKHSALAKLRRPWFAGGTVKFVSVQVGAHRLRDGYAAFEDGTVNYLNLPAIKLGLKYLETIGIESIHEHVTTLAGKLKRKLRGLRHTNGESVVRIYGPQVQYRCGGVVTMNFYDPEGCLFDHRVIEQRAASLGICLRTGCFCNPGSVEAINGLANVDVEENEDANESTVAVENTPPRGDRVPGAVRISLGIASNEADIERFLKLAATFIDERVKDQEKFAYCRPDDKIDAGC